MPTTTHLTTVHDPDFSTQELLAATGSISPNVNRLLVALIYVESAPGMANVRASGNGLTWTLSAQDSTSFDGNEFYCLTAPTGGSPSAGAVTVEWDTDPGNVWNVSIYEIDGADMVSPILSDATVGNANPGSPFCTFAGTTAGSTILGLCRRFNNSTNIVPPTGYTEDAEADIPGSARGYEVCHLDNAGATTTLTWGASNPDSLAYAVEVKAGGYIPVPPPWPYGGGGAKSDRVSPTRRTRQTQPIQGG